MIVSLDSNNSTRHIKAVRAWNRLTPFEKVWVKKFATLTNRQFKPTLSFKDMYNTRRRLLYALCKTGKDFTVNELVFILIVRWGHNTDRATVRSRLAEMAMDEDILITENGRYSITEQGLEQMEMHAARRNIQSKSAHTKKIHYTKRIPVSKSAEQRNKHISKRPKPYAGKSTDNSKRSKVQVSRGRISRRS